ncbi:hypothetical protein CPB86DRAFT_432621 [Serendipita vermifera]|nr:hypothetical protein CPB86DRAFT_432621 [Serendipita vermifera]
MLSGIATVFTSRLILLINQYFRLAYFYSNRAFLEQPLDILFVFALHPSFCWPLVCTLIFFCSCH